MKIIIPASGIGKRFIDAGYKDTKPLINVTPEKKIIDYVIDIFDKDKDEFFIITSSSTSSQMNEYLKTTNINYKHITLEESQAGPIGAIVSASQVLSKHISLIDEVIVSYCDLGMEWDYQDFLRFIYETKPSGCIPCYTGYHPHLESEENAYACCKVDNGQFERVVEKYKSDDKYNELWSPGVYYFKEFSILLTSATRMINAEDSLNGEYYASLLYNYINKNEVNIYDKVKKFYQFGTPADFEVVRSIINKKNNIINDSFSIKNTVILSAGAGERFINLNYKQPKPFIPLGKTDFVTNIINSFKKVKTDIICVGSIRHEVFWENSKHPYILIFPTELGAAISYTSACEKLDGETLIVPCDLLGKHINETFKLVKQNADAIIFTAKPSKYALNNEESFAWVGGENNLINDISIKKRNKNNDMVLIGSFWVRENQELIKNIIDIVIKKHSTNNEYYLDNAFNNMFLSGKNVKYVEIDNYFSLGTPSEYQDNKYWLDGVLDD